MSDRHAPRLAPCDAVPPTADVYHEAPMLAMHGAGGARLASGCPGKRFGRVAYACHYRLRLIEMVVRCWTTELKRCSPSL